MPRRISFECNADDAIKLLGQLIGDDNAISVAHLRRYLRAALPSINLLLVDQSLSRTAINEAIKFFGDIGK